MGMVMTDDGLGSSEFQGFRFVVRQPAHRSHAHRRAIAPTAISRGVIGKSPVQEHLAVAAVRMPAHERSKAGCKIARAHQSVGDRERADTVVGEPAIRMEKAEVAARCKLPP